MSGTLTLSLWAAAIASVLGAMLGALLLTQPEAALRRVGLAASTTWARAEARGFGGGLLVSHALTAATLLQAPKIGACFAGVLAAYWLGAALGKLVSLMRDRPVQRATAATVLLDLTLSVALASPLWAYVRLIRIHSGV